MPDVILLCSVHKENGRCNSDELFRILELIEPDVLFLEIPYFELLERSKFESDSILEVSAISAYLRRSEARPIFVDTLGGSSVEDNKLQQVIDQVSRAGPDLGSLLEQQIALQYANGFKYLNSRLCDSILRQVDRAVAKTLAELSDVRLVMAYDDWKIYNSKREDAMIRNIYEFCQKTGFKKAAFLFGSGHRRALIAKIQKVKKTVKSPVNWKLDWGARSFEKTRV